MTIESAKAFIERMKNDKEFAKKVKECKDTEERMEFVKAEGFDFTREEIKEVVGDKLTDDDLDSVVGGSMTPEEIIKDPEAYASCRATARDYW